MIRMRTFLLSSLSMILAAIAPPGCTAGTGGGIVEIDAAFQGRDEARSFAVGDWEVVLEEARIALGPAYAFAPREEELTFLERLSPRSIARAHGGFDPLDGRMVRAELLDQVAVDALSADPVVLPTLAEVGPSNELAVTLLPPTDANEAVMHGHQAWVRGVATRGDEERVFEGGLVVEDEGSARRVSNIDLDAVFSEGGTLTVQVDARRWLDGVDFERIPAEITPDSQAHAAWRIGARSPAAYAVTWTPQINE